MSIACWRRRISASDIDAFDLAFALLMAVLLALVCATFKEYAVSNDEGLQHHYGELIIAYYRSGFADRSVFDFGNLYLYGGLFDIVAASLAHLLPFDLYDIRHVISALAGLAGVTATWATARMIAGPRAGFIAALALALCGVWYGGMFNHTKDVPFASAMMGATFFLLRAARDLPGPRRTDILLFGIVLGCALGLRATGLLMIGYVFVLIIVRSWSNRKHGWSELVRCGIRSILQFVPAFAVGYVIMIASWPWASLEFLNPARAIFAFAHFHYPIRTIIAGRVYLMNEVPPWYEPVYLAIKLPLFVLLGALAALVLAAWSAVRGSGDSSYPGRAFSTAPDGGLAWNPVETGFLGFTVFFPLLCQIVGHGPSFTGMRHFMFVVPPLAALAGNGIHVCLSRLAAQRPVLGRAAFGAVVAALAWNAETLIRLHPYEYLYYNSLVGGLEGASRRYVMDYWVNIMPAAVRKLDAYLDKIDDPADGLRSQSYTVGVCGERVSFENEADRRLKWTSDWSHADFFIAPTHMNCDKVLRGKTVDVIERLGVPIGVIKDLRGVGPQARWAPVEVVRGGAGAGETAAGPHG